MMRTKFIFFVASMCLSTAVNAQGIDMVRMERDLEVAKNVLQSVLGQGDNYLMWSRNLEANYLEGYGVIFTLPRDYAYYFDQGGVVVGRERSQDTEAAAVQEEREDSKDKTKQAVITFLLDYSDLISQLKPSDRIMVHSKSRDDIFVGIVRENNKAWSVQESGNAGFSAEIIRKDVLEYKEGKITHEQAQGRIKITEAKPREKEQDLELFASIIRRLYSDDLSKTFFTERDPSYERLDGFGVIFNLNTFSSYENDNLYRMPVLGRDDVNKEERKKTIEELYPKFEDELKSVIVEYGRTIKSLDEDEVIMLRVKSTKCEGCNIPKSIELSIKKSILSQFDQRKISLEAAKKEVKVKKHFDN